MTKPIIFKSESQVKFNNLDQINSLVNELIHVHSREDLYSPDLDLKHEVLVYLLYNNLSGNRGVVSEKWSNVINLIRERNPRLDDKTLLEKLGDLILRNISLLIGEEIVKNVENVESFIDHLGEIEGINQDWWFYFILSWRSTFKPEISDEELTRLILTGELSWDQFRKHVIEQESIISNLYNVSKCNKLLNLLRIIFSYARGMLPLDEQGENYLIEIKTHHDVVRRLELNRLHKLKGKPLACYVSKDYMEALVQEVTKEWTRIRDNFISLRYLTFLREINLEYLLDIENYNNLDATPNSSKNATGAQKVAWLITSSQSLILPTTEKSLNEGEKKQVLFKPIKMARLSEVKNEFLVTLVKKQRQEIDQDIIQDWDLIVTDYIKKDTYIREGLDVFLILQASVGNLREGLIETFNAYKSENNLMEKKLEINNMEIWDINSIARGKSLIIKFILLLIFDLFFSILLEWGLFKILQFNYSEVVEEWVKHGKLRRNRNIIFFGMLMLLLLVELALTSKYFRETRSIREEVLEQRI